MLIFTETTNVPTTTSITTESSEITTSITTELSTTDFTSSSPPECIGGNIDERVCRLENENEELKRNLEHQSTVFSAALEELETRIANMENRPCSCI